VGEELVKSEVHQDNLTAIVQELEESVDDFVLTSNEFSNIYLGKYKKQDSVVVEQQPLEQQPSDDSMPTQLESEQFTSMPTQLESD